jgi:PAS domain S-box-containing protein
MISYFRITRIHGRNQRIFYLVIASICILLGGVILFRSESKSIHREIQNKLQFVAKIKMSEIVAWYDDELADAWSISQNQVLIEKVNTWLRLKNSTNEENLRNILSSFCTEHDYENIMLADDSGHLLYSVKDLVCGLHTISPGYTDGVDTFPSTTDFNWCPITGKIAIEFISIVNTPNDLPDVLIFFSLDPEKLFFPDDELLLYAGKSSEIIFYRKENDSLLVLNEPHHQTSTSVTLKIPVSHNDMPAMRALNGFSGLCTGQDYRGIKTISYVEAIPGTHWFLEAKIHHSELKAALVKNAGIIFGFTLLILLLLFAIEAYLYRNHERNIYKELSQAQEQFHITLQSIGDGVITTDKDCRLLYMNPQAEKLSGWKFKKAMNEPFGNIFKIIDELSREALICPARQILDSAAPIHELGTKILVSKNGIETPITINGSPILGDNGEITGVVLNIRDLTNERLANRQLMNERSRSRHYLDVAGVMMVALDIKGNITMINRRGCSILGYHEDGLIGRNWFEMAIPEGRRDKVKQVFHKIIAGDLGSDEYIEDLVTTRQGGQRVIAWHNTLLYDDRGDISGTLSSGEDITERKRDQEDLAQQKYLSESLIETIPDNIYFKNTDSRFILINRNMAKSFGLTTPEEAIGKSDFDFFEKEHATQALLDEQHIIETGEAMIGKEEKESWPGGKITWVNTTKVPLRDRDGKIMGIMGISRNITELKVAHEALRASEEKHRILLDESTDPIFSFDAGGRYLYANRAFANSVQIPVDQLLGKTVWDTFPREEAATRHQALSSVFEKGEARVIEMKAEQGGVDCFFLTTITPVKDSDNNVLSVICLSKDITERKKAEEALQMSQFSIDKAMTAIFWMGYDGSFSYVNEQACRSLGYTREELLKLHLWDIDPKYPKEHWDDRWVTFSINKQGGGDHLESVHRRKDGTEFPVEVDSMNIWFGSTQLHVAHVQDITERKKSQRAIQESEEIFRNFMEYSPVYVFFKDENIRSIKLSKNYEKMLGKTMDELIGKTMDDLFPSELARRMIEDDKKVLKEGKMVTVDEELDGRYYTTIKYPIQIDSNTRYLAGFTIDVTEKKQAEEILRKQKAEIEKQNQEFSVLNAEYFSVNEELRTSNEELAAARDKAQESDRLKSAFLANMSHEIRTPMNAIIGFSDLLNNPDLPPEKQQLFTRTIRQRSYDLLTLINDILDLSKIEAGQMNFCVESCNLDEILSDICSTFKAIWYDSGKSKVELLVENYLNPIENRIFTDSGRLRQILSNLVGNAFKFTQKGSITITCQRIESDLLQFSIKDTGIGISPEKKSIIFDRFRQADDYSAQQFGGTGLGLSISKGLVELFGGKIWVESKQGEGSNFFFTIPYKSDTSSRIVLDEPMHISYNWGKKKLLLVEDDEFNSEYTKEVLKETGIKVISMVYGKEAIKSVKTEGHFDLVLLDIRLPDIEGLEVAKQLKLIKPDLPIIAQTAYASENYRIKCKEAGCIDYLAKPIRQDELLRSIGRCLLGSKP